MKTRNNFHPSIPCISVKSNRKSMYYFINIFLNERGSLMQTPVVDARLPAGHSGGLLDLKRKFIYNVFLTKQQAYRDTAFIITK